MADILSDYQLEAISRMRNGCILVGGVGSGKSRTSLGYYCQEQGGEYKCKVRTTRIYILLESSECPNYKKGPEKTFVEDEE